MLDNIDRQELWLPVFSDAVLSPQAELYRWSQSMRGTHSVGKTPNADLVTEQLKAICPKAWHILEHQQEPM